MLNQKDLERLKQKSKEELLELIVTICNKNDNAMEYIHNVLNSKVSNSKATLKKIQKMLDNPASEYSSVYMVVKHFLETNISDQDSLVVAVETASFFIDDLESYGYMHPEELYDITIEVYEMALSLASRMKDMKAANELHYMIPGDLDSVYEEFINVFYRYFCIDDEENVIIQQKI
jgi:hypothetical protein